jgi:dipeptidyl aminopeptidase/acylaminoacyl peptidase
MQTDYTATDRRFINPTTLSAYCNTNAHLLTTTPRAFVLEFPGLGGGSCLGGCMEQGPYNSPLASFLAEQGILLAYLFPGPWSWMNRGAVRMVDAVVDALREQYGLTEATPWMVMGGSMGGQSALVYTKYAKRTTVACVTNCPVCDLVFHFTEIVDLPRTLYSAFYNENGTLNEVLKRFSPYHLAENMPNVKYHLFHCDKDGAVNIDKHSRVFVDEMKKYGKDIGFTVVNDRDHCDLTPEALDAYRKMCADAALGI